jgi:predicted TIM-barrel fold metal-dependent hydrolase
MLQSTTTQNTRTVHQPLEMVSSSSRNRMTQSSRDGFLVELRRRVDLTPMVDSHEHLQDECDRLSDNKNCIRLFRCSLSDDFASAGMNFDSVFGQDAEKEEPVVLWRRLAPFWNAIKNTGYGRAVQITVKELYGIDKIEESIIPQLQQEFEKLSVPGFYKKILRDHCNLESCQINRGNSPFTETTQPTLLLQDIKLSTLQKATITGELTRRVGIPEMKDLNDYHHCIRLWFQKYAPYAVAIKTQIAYIRGLDFEKVPAELAEVPFQKKLGNIRLSREEAKLLQDHLFWFCVELADEYDLPVKLHLGYYAGTNRMPVSRVGQNVAQAADLCLRSSKTRFMFMHSAYPYGHELTVIAKQFANAHVQTCWAWIIDPVGTKNFLKRYIVTAPSSKIHVFGGDYDVVENVVGHARIARNGVYSALAELVEEGYLERDDALELVEPLLRGNARNIFHLEEKYEAARNVPWNTTPTQ